MIGKIDYHTCQLDYPNFPRVDNRKEIFFFPEVCQFHILSISSKSAKGHGGNLSRELDKLFQMIGLENLIFLGEYKRAWRHQENSYPAVRDALAYLKQHKVTKNFDGALDVPKSEWPIFFKHLFWLVRCNAALPTFHFMDSRQLLLGSLCQYGNVHLSTLTAEAEEKLLKAINETSFLELHGERCHSSFSKSKRIAGKQTLNS
jgi:hypothetical protein